MRKIFIKKNRRSSNISLILSIFYLLMILQMNPETILAQDLEVDVPFVATPYDVVEKMLDLANTGKGDYLIDLGSGDGRIVIEAAKRGAIGHGVDIDPDLVDLSFERAKEEGVEDRVMFMIEDIFETDFSMATVVTIYMSPGVNRQMRPKFFKQLAPGTRVVSHIFGMGNWTPDKEVRIDRHNIYLWVIPADISGEWHWKTDEEEFQVYFGQTFQQIHDADFMPINNDQSWKAAQTKVAGERFVLIAENSQKDLRHVYSGTINANTINGFVQIHKNGSYRIEKWNASRTPD